MKFNFYFIHGWGFDKTFWNAVKKKVETLDICKKSESLDLKFFLSMSSEHYFITAYNIKRCTFGKYARRTWSGWIGRGWQGAR